jgi:cytidylate kinase
LGQEVQALSSIEAIMNRQLLRWESEKRNREAGDQTSLGPAPIVTISSQRGSRGSYFGSRLAQRLGYQRLHRGAIDEICESADHRRRILELLDGECRRRIELLTDELLAGKPANPNDVARKLCQATLAISELGSVVFMGRGGSFILGPQRGFHLRVVCPREKRIENLVKYKQLTAEEAAATIDQSDSERLKFITDLFGGSVDDPYQYDMVINSSLMDVEEIVDTAMVAINAKKAKLTYLDHDQI